MIKNVLFNKTKNTCVHLLFFMYSMCVQLFTAFELDTRYKIQETLFYVGLCT